MTDARCPRCGLRLRWGTRLSDGAHVSYCPVHTPDRVAQPIAIPVETEWAYGFGRPPLEELLPSVDATAVRAPREFTANPEVKR